MSASTGSAPGPRAIEEVAAELGLTAGELEPRGRGVAKVSLSALEHATARPPGRLVLVTAITPTAEGEGKTTTAIGLVDALRRLGVRAALTLRQPSLGPVFGRKGGGGGGGRARVVPVETVNLHLTGDLHAVAAAHNLAAAMIDNHLHHGNALGVEPGSITWPRAVDADDRALRRVVVGLGGRANGPAREAEWIITAASEVMAVLAIAEGRADLRARLGRIVVARGTGGALVSLDDLRAAGAMAALLRDAIEPNLLQTAEGSPVLVHAGPFGNVAQGTSSVLADRLALRGAEVVVTEAGFGADLGAEKFLDLKCRSARLAPAAAVLVATVRALRAHGGAPACPPAAALERGCENLVRHLAILREFAVPVVVALNAFQGDDPGEHAVVLAAARAAGARAAVVSSAFADGGEGAAALAAAVREVAGGPATLQLPYPVDAPLSRKVEAVATRVYGAAGVAWARAAAAAREELERLGYGGLPVCIAKTPFSLSHDPALGPHPRGFTLPVREVRLAAGAGFVTVLTGDVQLMPGLPAHPAAEDVDLGEDGAVTGLR